MALSAEQRQNAQIIFNVGVEMGMDAQTIAAAFATALMESGMRNLDYGDRDSLGLFQQRPSQGWGTAAQIRDPRYAARKFFEAYMRASGDTVLERIGNTQRPAAEYRGHYARHFATAEETFTQLTGQPAPRLTGARPQAGTGVLPPAAIATGSDPDAPAVSGNTGHSVKVDANGNLIVDTGALPPNATDQQIEDWIRENYPDVSGFLSNPEMRALLFNAARNDWDDTKLQAELRKTDYYKTHGPDSRRYDLLIAEDPNQAGRITERAMANVGDRFSRMGITATQEELGQVAKNLIRSGVIDLDGNIVDNAGFNDAAIFLMGLQNPDGSAPAGEVAFTADQLQSIAKEYLVPLTRRQLDQWAMDIAVGRQTEESFRSWMMGLAKARFAAQPDIVAALEKGLSPSQYFQGHVATVAQLLELDDTQIDLMDPKWMGLMETVDEKGNRRAPTLGEAANWARQRPEFANTRLYKSQEADFSLRMADFFGKVA